VGVEVPHGEEGLAGSRFRGGGGRRGHAATSSPR
jgi:hypothetical protein